MTQNERIAKVMGWRLLGIRRQTRYVDGYVDGSGCVLYLSDLETPSGLLWFSKLLQARMVKDGWEIKNYNATDVCQALARRCGETDYKICSNPMGEDEEPAAIVELFCKVYGIK
jgi:hypothetical protein